MAEQWRWIGPDGFEYTGNVDKLREGLSSGQLPWATNVWRAGFNNWAPASSVIELQPPGGFAPAAAPAQHFAPEDDGPTFRENPAPEAPPNADQHWHGAAVVAAHAEFAPPPKTQPLIPAPTPPQPQADPSMQAQRGFSQSGAVAYAGTPAAWSPETVGAPEIGQKKKSIAGLIISIVGAIGGALVLGSIAGIGAYAGSAAKKIPDVPVSALGSASAEAPAAAPAEPKKLACQAAPAKQLAKPAFGKVPLEVVEAGEGKIAIGFAESKDKAHALIVSLADLEKAESKAEHSDAPIAGVVPIVHGGELKLEIDADKQDLHAAKTVGGEKPFTLGSTHDGIVKKDGDGAPHTVWPGGEGEVTVPRVETLEGAGHFVAFRRGGQAGKLEAGWLEPDGDKKTDLVSPKLDATSVGTPAAAVSKQGVILLAAGRNDAKAPWQIFAGHADAGGIPGELNPLDLGDAAVSRISPSAASLGHGHWLLQWTEGAEDAHTVHVLPLDKTLAPVGEKVTVSQSGADSGQGLIYSDEKASVSLFLVSTGDGHELWGSVITCK